MYHQRFKSAVERFLEKVVVSDEHWLWQNGKDDCGYGFFWLEGRMHRAHRASWILYKGPIPEGLDVLHQCDIPGCVNPDCLFLGTRADNNRDRDQKGRHVALKGEAHGCAKITEQQAQWALDSTTSNTSTRQLREMAYATGISFSTLWRISRRRAWKHLQRTA